MKMMILEITSSSLYQKKMLSFTFFWLITYLYFWAFDKKISWKLFEIEYRGQYFLWISRYVICISNFLSFKMKMLGFTNFWLIAYLGMYLARVLSQHILKAFRNWILWPKCFRKYFFVSNLFTWFFYEKLVQTSSKSSNFQNWSKLIQIGLRLSKLV